LAGLKSSGEALKTAVEATFPPDDPFRPILDAIPVIMTALEAAETRIGKDYADRTARAAALGAQQWARALVRAEARKFFALIAGLMALVGLVGAAVGWLLAH
jgi:hypothetical protein